MSMSALCFWFSGLILAWIILSYVPDCVGSGGAGETGPEAEWFRDKAIGYEFMLTLMQNDGSTPDATFSDIFITSTDNSSTTVNIQAPGVGLDIISRGGKFTHKVQVSESARMKGSTQANNGILVTSSRPSTVHVFNRNTDSVDGFLALPVDMLGMQYYVICYSAPSVAAQLAIAAVYNGTSVDIHFPEDFAVSNFFSVTFDGTVYGRGDNLQISLNQFGTIQLQCDRQCDLTGTYINSSKPVAVFSGNVRASIPRFQGYSDHLVSQMIPTDSWGLHFLLVGASFMSEDVLTVLAQTDNTLVQIHQRARNPESVYVDAGEFIERTIPAPHAIYIIATKPVLVVQFLRPQQTIQPADPSMLIVPAVKQYSNDYRFSTPEGMKVHHLLISIRQRDTPGLLVDGLGVDTVISWQTIEGVDYVGASLEISSGDHIVHHVDPYCRFGLVLSSSGDKESIALPLALNLAVLLDCPANRTMQEGDGVDNDCDRLKDEELCDGLDNDSDGLIDEDCMIPPSTISTSTPTSTMSTMSSTTSLPPLTEEPELWEVFHCGVLPLRIGCSRDSDWIQIIQAHYGRIAYPEEKTCGEDNYQTYWEDKFVDRVCGYVDHFSTVSAQCDRKYNCTVYTSRFRDEDNPCPASGLYTHVTYRCVDAHDYPRNDLSFGAERASSEQEVGPGGGNSCARMSIHSPASCDAACYSPFLQGSESCRLDLCEVEYSSFSSDSVRGWCPDVVESSCAFIDSFLGDTHLLQGLVLQGGRRKQGWITQFTLYYSVDELEWLVAPTDRLVSKGNTDSVNSTLIKLSYPVPARWVRFKVIGFVGHPHVHLAYIHHHAVEVCPKLTVRNSNTVNAVGVYREERSVVCNSPYVLSNLSASFITKCNSDLHWEPVHHCDVISCGLLPEHSGYVLVRDDAIIVARVNSSYTCPPGDKNLGYELLVCDKRTWTWQWEGQCCFDCLGGQGCHKFPSAINAGITSDPISLAVGNVLQFECLQGFELVSASLESRCVLEGADYVWDYDVIECAEGNLELYRYNVSRPSLGSFLTQALVTDFMNLSRYTIGVLSAYDTIEAMVACRTLQGNFEATGLAASILLSDIDNADPVRWEDLTCDGREDNIKQCSHGWTTLPHHVSVAAVVCFLPDGCRNGEVRLLTVDDRHHGLVQICHLNTWGVISGRLYGWALPAAHVACAQMNYNRANSIHRPTDFNVTEMVEKFGPGWLHDIRCSGAEAKLIDCSFGTVAKPSTLGAGFLLRDRGHETEIDEQLAFAQCV